MKIISEKTKIKLMDYFHLIFKSAADNHIRIQRCIQDPNGEVKCDIVFNSYTSLKRFQKRLRRITLSLSGTIILIFVSTLVTQLILPVFKSKAATFDWVQTDWSGGVSALVSHNPDGSNNTTGVDTYASKDDGINAGATLTLASQSGTETRTTDADFSGAYSQAATSSGSVKLTLASPVTSTTTRTTDTDWNTGSYVSNSVLYDPDTGSAGTVGASVRLSKSTTPTWMTIGLSTSLYGMAFESVNQRIYTANSGGIILYCNVSSECDEVADWVQVINIGSSQFKDIVYDSASGVLYASFNTATANNPRIYRCDETATDCMQSGNWTYYDVSLPNSGYINDFLYDNELGVIYAHSYYTSASLYDQILRCQPSVSECDASGDWQQVKEMTFTDSGSRLSYDSTQNAIFLQEFRCNTSTGCDAAGEWTDTNNGMSYYVHDSIHNVLYGAQSGVSLIYRCQASSGCDAAGEWTNVRSMGSGNYLLKKPGFNPVNGYLYFADKNFSIYKCDTATECDADGEWPVDYTTLNSQPGPFLYDPVNNNMYAGGKTYRTYNLYNAPGTYRAYIDAGAGAERTWNSFSFDKTTVGLGTDTATIQIRAKSNDSATTPPADIATTGCQIDSTTSDGTFASSSISSCAGTGRYLWFEATLTGSTDLKRTPSLDAASANASVSNYNSSGTFESTAINTGQKTKTGSVSVGWDETLNGLVGDPVKLQIGSSNETYTDNFDGASLDTTNKWSQYAAAQPVSQSGGGLITDTTSTAGKYSGAWVKNTIAAGDFDVQVDFSLLEGYPSGCAAGSYPQYAALNYFATSGGNVDWGNSLRLSRICSAGSGEGYNITMYVNNVTTSAGVIGLADTNGKLRLVRQGSNFYAYYWNNSTNNWTLLSNSNFLNKTTFPTTVGKINVWSTTAATAVKLRTKFDNFIVWGDNNGDTSGGYFGPDGVAHTDCSQANYCYTNEAGTSLHADHNGSQYFRYKTYLSTDNTTITPTLDAFNLGYQYYGNKGPVALYHFDGTAGASVANATAIYDATKNANNGTFSNANNSVSPTTGYVDQTGNLDALGTAMTFDGVDDSIQIANNSSLQISDFVTAEAWVKVNEFDPDGDATLDVIMTKSAGATMNYRFNIQNNTNNGSVLNEFQFRAGLNGTAIIAHSAIVPNIGEWYYLTGLYDGSEVKIYVNGVLAGSTPATGSIGTDTSDIRIGYDVNGVSYFSGQVDELAIYDRALSASEIGAHYNAGIPSYIKSGSQPAHLVSSVYDSSDLANVITGFKLNGTSVYDNSMKVQMRSSADNATWTNWCGLNSCSGSDYINITAANLNGLQSFVSGHPFLNELSENNDQYLQYKLTLESDGSNTPTVTEATTQYVVNQTPVVSGVTASQDSSGVINVAYDLTDADNVSETAYVLADLGVTLNEELSNSDTAAITLSSASSLPTSGTIQIDNEQISYTSKSGNDLVGTITRGVNNTRAMTHSSGAVIWVKGTTVSGDVGADVAVGSGKAIAWTVKSDLDETYYATARIRVAANDGQAANQIGSGDSVITGFELDTKDPVVNSFSVISSTSDSEKTNDNTQNLSIDTTEDNLTNYQMRFSDDGVNWSGWEDYATSKSQWNLTDNTYGGSSDDGIKTVYAQFRDANGNMASDNDAITYDTTNPGTPINIKAQDASNDLVTPTDERIFLSWQANLDTDGDFEQYHLYRGSTISSVNDEDEVSNWEEVDYANKTDNTYNYYIDTTGISDANRYYYKLTTEDDIGNVSSESSVAKTVPDGSGGASISAPTISNLTVAEKGTTWARLTWDTSELSDSRVYYSTSAIDEDTDSSVLVATMTINDHELVVSGLEPGTEYNFRAKSINAISNSDTDDTSDTTSSGPRISGVIIPEVYNTQAKIMWSIDEAITTGTVYYTNSLDENDLPDFSSPSSQSADCSATSCEAELSGLTAGHTKYYFYVKADDATDKNIDRGQIRYFTFTTANDLAAPIITASGSPIGQPIVKSDNQAVIRWTTDESSVGRVLYKESEGNYNDPSWSSDYSRDNISVLNGLSRNTTYVYKIQTKDVNNNQSESDEYTFTTLAEQENHPDLTDPGDPTIDNLIYVGETEAVIKWQSNTESAARICYATSQITDMNSCDNEVNSDSASIIHVFHLENLTTNQTYYYRIETVDSVNSDISFTSSDSVLVNFATSIAGDITAPGLLEYSIVDTSPDSATISITSGEASIAFIQYLDTTTDFSDDYLEKSSSKEYVTTHTFNLRNLSQNKTYYFKIKLQDADGNTAVYDNSGLYYTFSTATGPEISEDPACSVKENSITINWETDEDSDSYVLYSIESDLDGYLKKGSSSSEENHSVTIEGLLPQTEYFYQASSQNSAGGVTTSDIESCATLGTGVDSQAPSISNVQAVFIGKNQALINWNTDEVATSQVEYDKTKIYSKATTKDNDMVTNHNVIVTGLDAGTIYHFRVLSKDASGNEDISDDYTFTTLGEQVSEDTLGNVISETTETPNISSSNATVSENDGDSVTITWKTDKEANSLVAYKPEGSDTYKTEGNDSEFVASHEVILNNLSPNTKYTFYVKSTDSLGNAGESSTDTFTTNAVSTIFNVEVVDITYDSATVSWETSINATSLIEYGKTSSFGDKTNESSSKTKAHAVKISGLDSGTKYYFRIKGKDSSSNLYTSSEYNFVTPAPPQIADFKVDSITEHKIKVAFKTNIDTDAFLTLSKKDANEGDENAKVTSGDPKMGIEHSLEADNLESGTTYTLEVQVRDNKGNATIEKIDDYTTAKDENPPKVDQIRTDSALTQNDKVQAIISWKTDEPATTEVIYKEGRSGQEKEAKFNDSLTSSHTAVITTFKPGTVYYFKVKSIDAAGNEGKSTDFALLTPRRKENIIQIIVNNFQDIFGWAQR
ncbi:MAG: PKD protein [uncultured bacterium]|nr:MAG: PKD protein [uncultured bacterium]